MKTITNTFKDSKGITLVELMIAMAISAILMLGIIEIFSINSRSYKVQDENARMQESGRYAFNTLMTDIRRAGYFGGSANTDEMTGSLGITTPPVRTCISTDTSWARMLERPFYGLNDGNTDTDLDSLTVDYTGCIPDSDYLRGDILISRYTSGTTITAFSADQIYVRNSMFSGRVFKGSQEADAENVVVEIPNEVRELAATAYYVGPSGRTCNSDNTIATPALQREILSSAGLPIREEVANGVENIQFQYGIDVNGDLSVNQYVDANDLSNNDSISPSWAQIIAIKLWILVRADCPTNNYTNTKVYAIGDINYQPNDNFKRQLYSTTVSVRN